jgi:hypothetical protein
VPMLRASRGGRMSDYEVHLPHVEDGLLKGEWLIKGWLPSCPFCICGKSGAQRAVFARSNSPTAFVLQLLECSSNALAVHVDY